MKTFLSVLFSVLCIVMYAWAQPGGNFKIVQMPAVITNEMKGVKAELNEKLKAVTSSSQAFSIVNARLTKFKGTPVRLRQLTGNVSQYYWYYVGGVSASRTNIVDIKASRDVIDEKIYQKHQLRLLFQDTLAIIDTLVLQIFPSDFRYKNADYYLQNENQERIALPSRGRNEVLIISSMVGEPVGVPVVYTLFNKSEEEKKIASFYLRSLRDEDLEEFAAVAASVKEDMTAAGDFQDAAFMTHLQEYARSRWGTMQKSNIAAWLGKLK
jgi:hypothetical protein